MKQFIYITIFVFILTFTIYPQSLAKIEPCKVSINEFPALENLKLGMSFSEIENKVGGFSDVYPLMKYQRMVFIKPPRSKFQKIQLTFLDDDLKSIDYNYNLGSNYGSIEAYSKNVSTSFGLPTLGWTYSTTNFTDGSGVASMRCYGFDVRAHLLKVDGVEGTSLGIEDVNVTPTLLLRDYETEKMKTQQTKKRVRSLKP